MLFPDGRISNFDNFARLINAACLAVREFDESIPIALQNHLGRDNAAVRKWVDGFLQRKSEFDIIGMSCYAQAYAVWCNILLPITCGPQASPEHGQAI